MDITKKTVTKKKPKTAEELKIELVAIFSIMRDTADDAKDRKLWDDAVKFTLTC